MKNTFILWYLVNRYQYGIPQQDKYLDFFYMLHAIILI